MARSPAGDEGRRLRIVEEELERRNLGEQPSRLAGIVPVDLAAARNHHIRCEGGGLESTAVDGKEMPAAVHDEYGSLDRDPIEIGARRVPAERGVVIARSDDPGTSRACSDSRAHPIDELVHGSGLGQRHGPARHEQGMEMGVIESRHDGALSEIA